MFLLESGNLVVSSDNVTAYTHMYPKSEVKVN